MLVFEQPQVSTDACKLLKTLFDRAGRDGSRAEIFRKLRFIVAHSTDYYSTVNINYSPLNGVGDVLTLEEFNRDEVIGLTRRYNFNFSANQIEKLRSRKPLA